MKTGLFFSALLFTALLLAAPVMAQDSLGGGMARQRLAPPAPVPQTSSQSLSKTPAPSVQQAHNQQDIAGLSEQDYGFKDETTQGRQEYRGYNGRTIEQAFYRCKYESFRAAPPGDPGRGLLSKLRIRMYVMDVCMNSEGFFRRNRRTGIPDFDLVSSGDFFF